MGYSWFIPGLIQPIHALMILLVHLDGCMCPDDEAIMSRDLIDQVFSVRLGHMSTGGVLVHFTTTRFNNLRNHNSRYSHLITLKTRVWQKLGWSIQDPPNPKSPQDRSNGELGDINPIEVAILPANSDIVFEYEYSMEDLISMLWDELTPGSYLDVGMSNWDEWNLLSASLFTDGSSTDQSQFLRKAK
ncbi:hypothetical protein BX600DRAFT_523353 [Xylariales sp. PMI_506]|nr:hypothetical protein BX600DRAFT_523353 [Xylariales sp. PMI_506]